MLEHFDHQTKTDEARILIVDGHSSHIPQRVIQYALNHNIHIVQLPCKLTHILQPRDVGCFGLLQNAYERYHREWLLHNPLSAIRKVHFLELLFNARTDTYSVETIQKAWEASGC